MSNPRVGDNFTNITTATTTVVKSTAGTLRGITVNTAVTSGTVTIYNNSAASGTKVGTVTMPGTLLQNHFFIPFNVWCNLGITVVTTGTPDITVVWN